jgi:hypothetical protein
MANQDNTIATPSSEAPRKRRRALCLLAVVAALAVAGIAEAQTMRCDTVGGRQFCTGPNGYRSTQDEIGGRTFGNDSLGNRWTTDQLGGSTFTNIQPGYRNRGW